MNRVYDSSVVGLSGLLAVAVLSCMIQPVWAQQATDEATEQAPQSTESVEAVPQSAESQAAEASVPQTMMNTWAW